MVESLGLESGIVRVVPYDSSWPELYAKEVARITPVLAAHGVRLLLEHTGSTAVPGLAAKPILDLLAGRHRDQHRQSVIEAIEAAGYVYRGEQGIVGRDFFRRGDPRQYHLHLTEIDSDFWRDHRAFRDHLRTHPGALAAYATLKFELAARYPKDREAYIDGKTAFVAKILADSRGSSHAPRIGESARRSN